MKVAVGLRRVAAGKRTSGRRAAQIAEYPPICGYSPDFWRTLIKHLTFSFIMLIL